MIRPAFIEVALFLTPFALYALWLLARHGQVFAREWWPNRSIGTLTLAALLLMAASFVLLAHFSGAEQRGSTYVPAHVDDQGRLVPGEFK